MGKPYVCPICNGSGYVWEQCSPASSVCKACGGCGYLWEPDCHQPELVPPTDIQYYPCPSCATKDTEIAELKAEIAKLKGQKKEWTFHPVSHRGAICEKCGKQLCEHEIIEITPDNGIKAICPKDHHEQSP